VLRKSEKCPLARSRWRGFEMHTRGTSPRPQKWQFGVGAGKFFLLPHSPPVVSLFTHMTAKN